MEQRKKQRIRAYAIAVFLAAVLMLPLGAAAQILSSSTSPYQLTALVFSLESLRDLLSKLVNSLSSPPAKAQAALAPVFQLTGEPSEVSGTTHGALVTTAVAPAGLTGTLVVKGTGSVNFAPAQVGQGVSFGPGGQQFTNSAYYKFTGAQIGNIFSVDEGEVNFYLKSKYSFTERQALPSSNARVAFAVIDGTGAQMFKFSAQAGARLIFYYRTGATNDVWYYIPVSQEDSLYGKDVILKVKLTWNGTQSQLFLNDALVATRTYTKAAPNWGVTSSFIIGANTIIEGSGASDDFIDEFQVQSPTSTPPPPSQDTTAPTVSVSHTPAAPTTTDPVTLTATASDASGIASITNLSLSAWMAPLCKPARARPPVYHCPDLCCRYPHLQCHGHRQRLTPKSSPRPSCRHQEFYGYRSIFL